MIPLLVETYHRIVPAVHPISPEHRALEVVVAVPLLEEWELLQWALVQLALPIHQYPLRILGHPKVRLSSTTTYNRSESSLRFLPVLYHQQFERISLPAELSNKKPPFIFSVISFLHTAHTKSSS